jgi:hypothetical protein
VQARRQMPRLDEIADTHVVIRVHSVNTGRGRTEDCRG